MAVVQFSSSVLVNFTPSGFSFCGFNQSSVNSTPIKIAARLFCPGSVTFSTTNGCTVFTPGMLAARMSSTTDRFTPNSPLLTNRSPTPSGVVVCVAADSMHWFKMRDETNVATPSAMLATMSAARSQRWIK